MYGLATSAILFFFKQNYPKLKCPFFVRTTSCSVGIRRLSVGLRESGRLIVKCGALDQDPFSRSLSPSPLLPGLG